MAVRGDLEGIIENAIVRFQRGAPAAIRVVARSAVLGIIDVNLCSLFGVSLGMQELADLSAEIWNIALSRFRLLEPHLEQHRSLRAIVGFP
jgi:hypothetical protein